MNNESQLWLALDEKQKHKFMGIAIKEAMKAKELDEVPIGAVIVIDGKVVAKAHNLVEKTNLATAHAEVIAINKASKKLNSWRLDNAQLFVTMEPCAMCAGAIANSRIKKVFFGAYEPKSGCAESKYPILAESGLNHTTLFEGGLRGEECAEIIKNYFKSKRGKKS